MNTYFIVAISDLTNEILLNSTSSNPFELRRSNCGKYVIVEFESLDNVPLKIFQSGCRPYSAEEIKSTIEGNTAIWEADPQLVHNESHIEIEPKKIVLTDKSGNTSEIPETSTKICDENPDRSYFIFQNLSQTEVVYINFGEDASDLPGSFKVGPLAVFTMENSVLTSQQINVFSKIESIPYTAKEG